VFKEEKSHVLNKIAWQEMCLKCEINANFKLDGYFHYYFDTDFPLKWLTGRSHIEMTGLHRE
jgi:hypothetical protein